MSVRTRADECRDEAREYIRNAAKALSEIVVDECWGNDDFNDAYRRDLAEVFVTLMQLKKKL